ncbi:MAG TPA: DUF2142 domain-containing protein [Planctomycetota bacterium]
MRYERLFLWIAVPFGLLFALFNPPFRGVPDEVTHYLKALALARGELSATGTAPSNYVELAEVLEEDWAAVRLREEWIDPGGSPAEIPPLSLLDRPKRGIDREGLRASLTQGPSAEQTEFTLRLGHAYPFGYVPQTLGLWLGLTLRAPPLIAFWMGRLATLAVAVAALYLAIRVAPFGKRLFLLLGLLPGTLRQMASYSYDALHIAGLFLFVAYALALSQRPGPLKRGELARLFALSLTGSITKPGYALMPLLVLLLPRRAFRSTRVHACFAGATIGAGLLLMALAPWILDAASVGASKADPAAQAAHVLAHPLAFLEAIGEACMERGPKYLEGLVLLVPGRSSSLSAWLFPLVLVGLVILLRSQDDVVRLARFQRVVLVGTSVAQALLVFLSLYIMWTPLGHGQVLGIQGRYFLALVPPVVLGFQGSGFTLRSEWIRAHPRAALLTFVLGVLGYAVVKLGFHYY